MAEINIERKGRSPWVWIIPLILLALLLWWFFAGDDDDAVMAPVATDIADPAMAPPPPMAPGMQGAAAPTGVDSLIPVAVIVTAPVGYVGQTLTGTARVADVVSDRGFWLEQDGQRMFAVIQEPPEGVNINSGQMVRLAGTVYDAATLDRIPGGLAADTRSIIDDQPAFLYVRAEDVTILGTGG